MTQTDNGGSAPAFPVTAGNQVYATGMTLRDWFAGHVAANHMQLNDHNASEHQARQTAKWAYMAADAMIAARKETE